MDEIGEQILNFEAVYPVWHSLGGKAYEIRRRFDLSATRYNQIVNQLLDDPEAAMHSPATVGRLRRIREQRRVARSA